MLARILPSNWVRNHTQNPHSYLIVKGADGRFFRIKVTVMKIAVLLAGLLVALGCQRSGVGTDGSEVRRPPGATTTPGAPSTFDSGTTPGETATTPGVTP